MSRLTQAPSKVGSLPHQAFPLRGSLYGRAQRPFPTNGVPAVIQSSRSGGVWGGFLRRTGVRRRVLPTGVFVSFVATKESPSGRTYKVNVLEKLPRQQADGRDYPSVSRCSRAPLTRGALSPESSHQAPLGPPSFRQGGLSRTVIHYLADIRLRLTTSRGSSCGRRSPLANCVHSFI